MASFRILEAAFVQPSGHAEYLHASPGTVVELAGPPPIAAMPLDAAAREAYVAMLDKFRSRGRDWPEKLPQMTARKIAIALGLQATDPTPPPQFIIDALEQPS